MGIKVNQDCMITTVKELGTSIVERIGNTPLVRLEGLTDHLPGVQILGKEEWANPGGSVASSKRTPPGSRK